MVTEIDLDSVKTTVALETVKPKFNVRFNPAGRKSEFVP